MKRSRTASGEESFHGPLFRFANSRILFSDEYTQNQENYPGPFDYYFGIDENGYLKLAPKVEPTLVTVGSTTTGAPGTLASVVNSGTPFAPILDFTIPRGDPGITSLAPIGNSPNANGMTLTGSTLNLQPANASFGGAVTIGTQSFNGSKSFINLTTFPAGIRLASSSNQPLNYFHTQTRNSTDFSTDQQIAVGAINVQGVIINPAVLQGYTIKENRLVTFRLPSFLILNSGGINPTTITIVGLIGNTPDWRPLSNIKIFIPFINNGIPLTTPDVMMTIFTGGDVEFKINSGTFSGDYGPASEIVVQWTLVS